MAKKTMMIAELAGALALLVVPPHASATWTDNHQNLSENRQVEVTGQVKLESQIGAIECQVRSVMQLLAGQTTAQVTVSEIDLTEAGSTVTSKCSVDPTLEGFGCTDVASGTTAGLPWTAHAISTQTIATTTGTAQLHLHGGLFCLKTLQLTPGTVHSTLTTSNTWTTGSTIGQLQVHQGAGSPLVTIQGHGTVGTGRYGVS